MKKDLNIAIIGAGICGLTTGIALKSRGFKVTIYERAPDLRAVGAGITLWHNAMLVLKHLGISDQIEDAGRAFRDGGIFDSNGKQLVNTNIEEFDTDKNINAIAIHRADLLRILTEKVGQENIEIGRQFEHYQTNPFILHFNDNYSVQPDLVLSADGIFSTTRNQMYEADPLRYSGYTAYRGVVQYDKVKVDQLLHEMGEYWGKGKRFGIVPISDTQVYWFATVNVDEDHRVSQMDYQDVLHDHFDSWTEMITNLIKDTPANQILRNNIYDIKPIRGWYDGNICLMGDAAHATTPNMGQGAGMAIEDAIVMADLMVNYNDVSTIFQKFEDIRFDRCMMITKTSYRIGNVGSWQNAFITTVRDTLIKLTPWYTKQQLYDAITFDYLETKYSELIEK